jgi:DNA-binding NtrC family response regulator
MAAAPTARVLIVDDEEALLQLMERFVSSLGYEVEVFSSGKEAWNAIAQAPLRYSLVIVDLTMPDMPGDELAQRILIANSAVRVLICSGYPIDKDSYPPSQRERIGFLHKPFLPKMLLEAVEELMEGGRPGEARFHERG